MRLANWIGLLAAVTLLAALTACKKEMLPPETQPAVSQPEPTPSVVVPPATIPLAQTPPGISGGGNFMDGQMNAGIDAQFDILTAAGAHAIRMNLYPSNYYSEKGPTPTKLDAQVLEAHRRGVQTISLFFEYAGQYQKLPEFVAHLGDSAKWRAIGHDFAERFAPNSAFLLSHDIHDWGITIYQGLNEPDEERNPTNKIPITGPSSYVSALEGLAEGVHSVSPALAVIAGGFGSQNSAGSYTLQGYGPAIAGLLNDGKLDGIDLHTYNDILYAPIVGKDNQVHFSFSTQAVFDRVKKACGITRDIDFYCTEYNFKSGVQGIDDNLAAKRLLTCIWANLGVVKSDGHTPATKLALVWNLFGNAEKEYGLTAHSKDQAWNPYATGKTFELVMSLTSGMAFTYLDPLDKGEFTLAGNGKTLWVWQNYETFSSIHGTHYTVNSLPSMAKTLQVYGWDGLRKTIDLHGETALTINDLNERETYMFLATQ